MLIKIIKYVFEFYKSIYCLDQYIVWIRDFAFNLSITLAAIIVIAASKRILNFLKNLYINISGKSRIDDFIGYWYIYRTENNAVFNPKIRIYKNLLLRIKAKFILPQQYNYKISAIGNVFIFGEQIWIYFRDINDHRNKDHIWVLVIKMGEATTGDDFRIGAIIANKYENNDLYISEFIITKNEINNYDKILNTIGRNSTRKINGTTLHNYTDVIGKIKSGVIPDQPHPDSPAP